MTTYTININGQTLIRKSKRSDFTHAIIGRHKGRTDTPFADENFKIIAVRTSKESALKELRGWTMSHEDAQVVEL
jgi:hypothetical protein